MAKAKTTAGMSDEAVKKATGRTWPEWIKVLDKEGADKLDHKGIVAIVSEKYGVGSWWRQMVTVGYEQARGLREKHQTATGYSVSASRTLPVSAEAIFRAWTDAKQRRGWLPEPLTIRKATPPKSIRITWGDGKTSVEVMFYPKGSGKTQVTVQHSKLKNATAAKKMKQFWSEALDRLKGTIE